MATMVLEQPSLDELVWNRGQSRDMSGEGIYTWWPVIDEGPTFWRDGGRRRIRRVSRKLPSDSQPTRQMMRSTASVQRLRMHSCEQFMGACRHITPALVGYEFSSLGSTVNLRSVGDVFRCLSLEN